MMQQITPQKGNICPELFSHFFLFPICVPDFCLLALGHGKHIWAFPPQFNANGFLPATESESAMF